MGLSWTSLLKNHGGVWEDTDRAACCVLGRLGVHVTSEQELLPAGRAVPCRASPLCLWLPLD